MNESEPDTSAEILTAEGVFIEGDQIVVVMTPAERDELVDALERERWWPQEGGPIQRLVDALAAPTPMVVVQ